MKAIKFNKKSKYVCKKLFVKESTIKGAGLGLFANEDIYIGENISRYWGNVTDKSAFDINSVYLLSIGKGRYIDAKDQLDCPARYANDSLNAKTTNAIFIHTSRTYVYMVATKDIKKGEEIFVDYGKRYWKQFKLESQ